jgi:hypothetical protein
MRKTIYDNIWNLVTGYLGLLIYWEYQLFSRMRSKGSRFTLGVWGLRVCLLDVAFASATVCNGSREVPMAVPMGSGAKVGTFAGGFKSSVTSFCVAGVALCDIPTCFITW